MDKKRSSKKWNNPITCVIKNMDKSNCSDKGESSNQYKQPIDIIRKNIIILFIIKILYYKYINRNSYYKNFCLYLKNKQE